MKRQFSSLLALIALLFGLWLLWPLFIHFFLLSPTVIRQVTTSKWQCSDCVFTKDTRTLQSITKVRFQAHYTVFRPPSELGKIPDGGTRWYLKRETKAFELDVPSGQLTPMADDLPNPSEPSPLEPYLRDLGSMRLATDRPVTEKEFREVPVAKILDPMSRKTFTATAESLGFSYHVVTFPLFFQLPTVPPQK